MKVRIRSMTKEDVSQAGEVLYRAFNSVASQHGYLPRMNSVQVGRSWAWSILRHQPREIMIAELGNSVVGICCFNPREILAESVLWLLIRITKEIK